MLRLRHLLVLFVLALVVSSASGVGHDHAVGDEADQCVACLHGAAAEVAVGPSVASPSVAVDQVLALRLAGGAGPDRELADARGPPRSFASLR